MICNVWCWFRLPETKDRTFGEIDIMFDNKVSARQFKYTTVDRKSNAYSYPTPATQILTLLAEFAVDAAPHDDAGSLPEKHDETGIHVERIE